MLILFQYIATRYSGRSTCAGQFEGEGTTTLVYLYVLSESRAVRVVITEGYAHVLFEPCSRLPIPWPRRFAFRLRLCSSSRAKSPAAAMGTRYSLGQTPMARRRSRVSTIPNPREKSTRSELLFEVSFQRNLIAPGE